MAAILFAVTVKAFSGIVVIDTSHAIEFTKHINVEKDREIFKDFQIVAAYKYGSKSSGVTSAHLTAYAGFATIHS